MSCENRARERERQRAKVGVGVRAQTKRCDIRKMDNGERNCIGDPTREPIEDGEMDKESFRYLYVPIDVLERHYQ